MLGQVFGTSLQFLTFFQNHWPTFQKEEIQPLTSVKVLRHVAYYVWYDFCEFHLLNFMVEKTSVQKTVPTSPDPPKNLVP